MRVLISLLLLCASLPALAQEKIIRIWGPAAMEQVAQDWAEAYRAMHPDVRFELTMKGSDTAMAGLYTGKADLALMGRENEITDNNGFGRVKGYPPVRIELMRGSLARAGHSPALAVLVANSSPLQQITMAELRALFAGEARARLHMPDARSGTGRFFVRAVLGGSNKLNWPAITEYPVRGDAGWKAIAAAVRADPEAIGIGTLADLDGLRALPVVPDKGSQAIPANPDTLRLGLYPLTRRAYAFVDLRSGAQLPPHLADFLRFTMSAAGQTRLREAGAWLPVDEMTITRNLTVLSMPMGDPSPLAREVAAANPAYRLKVQVSGTISIWGHGSFKRDFMGRLVRRWFGEFQHHHPQARLDYRMYGTASAIDALVTGAGNLAILGEEISPEQAETFRRAHGYDAAMIEIANGSLQTNFFDYSHMVFVHKDNPLSAISLPQLERLFGAERKCGAKGLPIRKWGDLGLSGDWAEKPITPHMWKTDTDFAMLLRERALCDSHRWTPATREVLVHNKADGTPYDLGQQLVDAVGRDRHGIGLSNLRFPHPQVKPLAVSWTDGGPAVQASEKTLIDRSYPLGRIIPAYVDRRPGQPLEPVLREFLRFILSREGQTAMIEESGYLPLGATTASKQREALK